MRNLLFSNYSGRNKNFFGLAIIDFSFLCSHKYLFLYLEHVGSSHYIYALRELLWKNKDFNMQKQKNNTHEEQLTQDVSDNQENKEHQPKIIDNDKEETIASLAEKIENLQEKLLRQLAESENIRTRSSKLVKEARDYAIFAFTKDLIPVMDNLSRALEHLPEQMDDNMKNVVEGVKITKNELESVFKTHSLKSIEPQSGDKFDYHFHYAISRVMTEDYKEDTIVSTMQIGYKIKDRLVRPATVTVAKSN